VWISDPKKNKGGGSKFVKLSAYNVKTEKGGKRKAGWSGHGNNHAIGGAKGCVPVIMRNLGELIGSTPRSRARARLGGQPILHREMGVGRQEGGRVVANKVMGGRKKRELAGPEENGLCGLVGSIKRERWKIAGGRGSSRPCLQQKKRQIRKRSTTAGTNENEGQGGIRRGLSL